MIMGASKNSKFAQTQGARKFCEHPLRGLPAYPVSLRCIWIICKHENFLSNAAVGMRFGFVDAPICKN